MDLHAHELANRLVNNEPSEATIELTLWGDEFIWDEDVVVAITGADLNPLALPQTESPSAGVRDATGVWQQVPMWRPIFLPSGTRIRFTGSSSGCRAYLAIAGGWNVPWILGSRSTYMRAQFGGHEGRRLKTGDCIPHKAPSRSVLEWMSKLRRSPSFAKRMEVPQWYIRPFDDRSGFPLRPSKVLRWLPGPEFHWLSEDSQKQLQNASFQVSKDSDRMGYRLIGCKLSCDRPLEMVSDGVVVGTVQLPPEGDPIVIMNDGAPTGGYPRVGCIATIDMGLAAQLRPGDFIQFESWGLNEAQQALRRRGHWLSDIVEGIQTQWERMAR